MVNSPALLATGERKSPGKKMQMVKDGSPECTEAGGWEGVGSNQVRTTLNPGATAQSTWMTRSPLKRPAGQPLGRQELICPLQHRCDWAGGQASYQESQSPLTTSQSQDFLSWRGHPRINRNLLWEASLRKKNADFRGWNGVGSCCYLFCRLG